MRTVLLATGLGVILGWCAKSVKDWISLKILASRLKNSDLATDQEVGRLTERFASGEKATTLISEMSPELREKFEASKKKKD